MPDPRWLWVPSGWFAPFCASAGSAHPATSMACGSADRRSDTQVSLAASQGTVRMVYRSFHLWDTVELNSGKAKAPES